MNKVALILGIGGQDGSYLADILLERGYEVHGLHRRSSVNNLSRIAHITDRIILHRADMSDGASVERCIRECRPTEIYNEADQDHVGFSTDTPQVSIDITAGAVQRLLETVLRVDKRIKVFQPLSATMFKGSDSPLDENSELDPQSPYAIAKVAAWYLCKYYRKLGLWVSCGIMFNHESPRRGPNYLLQRIIKQAKEVVENKRREMEFSNINMAVDIGHAFEYTQASTEIIQLSNVDICVGTGVPYTIRQLCNLALLSAGMRFTDGLIKEIYPPMQAPKLIADCTRANELFGWNPKLVGSNLVASLLEGGVK